MSSETQDIVDEIINATGTSADRVIPILQAIQGKFNYLPEDALKMVCEKTEISPSSIHGIATFYSQFRLKPVGKHIIKVCVGTACHVKGAMLVFDAFKRILNLKEYEDTDKDGLFTIEEVACLGCCTLAPVVQIDDVTYGHVQIEKVTEILTDFKTLKSNPTSTTNSLAVSEHRVSQGEIRVGLGSCCVASGSAQVKAELEKSLKRNNITVDVKQVGCVGICNQVPILEIHKEGDVPTFYAKIKPEEVNEVIRHHFKSKNKFDQLKNNVYNFFENIVIASNPKTVSRYSSDRTDTPVSEFLKGQLSIATEFRGEVKPNDLSEYKAHGGFKALRRCLIEMSPEQVIDTVKQSGLRGRGGAGFPSAIKWQLVNSAVSETRYVICNGDEGDPGAFMDRMLLESYPFRVIEGMIIAAYAVGASQGIFYIRAEYPLAVKRITEAISICENEGILGKNIFKSKFSFKIKIFAGAGAFVCGEETALIASIEGRRGLPTMRPPYPAEKGLWGKPTLINNVETFSLVSWIFRNGHEAFSKVGTENSKGTKVFALAGKIKRGGLIEVPMGISIHKIVNDIGGGIPDGKSFKAIQIGGPSGGCIPASMADITIDYASLTNAGAMMGSGGLIVLDETDCMVDIARYFLSFTQSQSCGRCTFCRIGTRRMLDILEKICNGKGTLEDIVILEDLAIKTKKGSLCGLGKTAPNPVLSTLKYFRDEYIAHIDGHCPTGKCKNIIKYSITDDCIGCTKCAQRCPSNAIEMRPYEVHQIDTEKCIKCDICKQVCPVNAVIYKNKESRTKNKD
jgi:NADH:ubiquinone oxidoreductase subunit F (NADH-binding)/NADH:ubiquinone oxidoreductase subunit E/Pyruvate/2-oxoacid:ferredoxin oxidoreductase delta subunit